MHILLTNDDGYGAPGLAALHHAIAGEHTITITAPAAERSSCGHGTTMTGPIRVRRLRAGSLGQVYAVDGTPADCVRLAVAELATERIDCVVSGINLGANVSIIDTSQSGTVAAAREAVFCGLPGIAFSQMYDREADVDWQRSADIAWRLLPQLVDASRGRSVVWNVNIPHLPPGASPRGIRVVRLSCDHIPLEFAGDGAPLETGRTYRYNGYYQGRVNTHETDVAAVFDGFVAVTPLGIDATYSQLRGIELSL